MKDVLSSPCSSAPEAWSAPGSARPSRLCRPVLDAEELAEHHRIRREVFVHEQRLFVGGDVDGRDAHLVASRPGLIGRSGEDPPRRRSISTIHHRRPPLSLDIFVVSGGGGGCSFFRKTFPRLGSVFSDNIDEPEILRHKIDRC